MAVELAALDRFKRWPTMRWLRAGPGTSWQHMDSLLVVWEANNSPDGPNPQRRQLSGEAHQCQPVQASEMPCSRVEEQRGDEGKLGGGVPGPGHDRR
jgi:hypothetical protein